MKTRLFVLGLMAILYIIIIRSISAIVGYFLWTYSINEWLMFIGESNLIDPWHGALLGFIPFIGWWSVVVSLVTFILMLFIK